MANPSSNDPLEGLKENVSEIKDKVDNVSGEERWSMICYIPVVNLVTCALCGVRMVNSKLCRFHSRQGLALFGLWFFTIVVALFSQILSLMLWGVVLVLHAAGIVISYGGKMTKIPIIGQLAMRIPEYYMFEFLTGKKPEIENNTNNN